MEDHKHVDKGEASIAFNVNSDINTSSVEMDHKEDHSTLQNENNSLLINQFQETSMYDKEENKDMTTNEISVNQPFPMKIRNWKKRKPGVYNNKTKPHLMLKNQQTDRVDVLFKTVMRDIRKYYVEIYNSKVRFKPGDDGKRKSYNTEKF